jgi:Raf kinase inhibitor-like YbhB/YbcL family protein
VLAALIAALIAAACADEGPSYPGFEVSSPAFGNEETIPERHTCDGSDISPPLVFDELPAKTVSLAVIMDEPDALEGKFTHWLLWGIPVTSPSLPEDVQKIDNPVGNQLQGTNDGESIGYRGPCPGEEDTDEHRYVFRVYALKSYPVLEAGAGRQALEQAMKGQIVGLGKLVTFYKRED